jgi:hypothetical protein
VFRAGRFAYALELSGNIEKLAADAVACARSSPRKSNDPSLRSQFRPSPPSASASCSTFFGPPRSQAPERVLSIASPTCAATSGFHGDIDSATANARPIHRAQVRRFLVRVSRKTADTEPFYDLAQDERTTSSATSAIGFVRDTASYTILIKYKNEDKKGQAARGQAQGAARGVYHQRPVQAPPQVGLHRQLVSRHSSSRRTLSTATFEQGPTSAMLIKIDKRRAQVFTLIWPRAQETAPAAARAPRRRASNSQPLASRGDHNAKTEAVPESPPATVH